MRYPYITAQILPTPDRQVSGHCHLAVESRGVGLESGLNSVFYQNSQVQYTLQPGSESESYYVV